MTSDFSCQRKSRPGRWSPAIAVLVWVGGAASGAVDGPSSTPARPGYKSFRFDEDFSALADPALRTQPLDDLKYIPLGDEPRTWLTLGGEARTRYEYFNEPGFGLRGLSKDDFVLQRLLFHADLHVGDHFRVFAQSVSAWQIDPESATSPLQDDALDVQQAFADVVIGDPRGDRLLLRGGRMEMGFGSFRLVTPRDPTNVRLNFDGVRATLHLGRATIDAFLTRPVEQKRGIFNDGENDAQTFWGVYSSVPIDGPALNLDAYYLGLRRENARFDAGSGTDERHSLGARAWGRAGGFDYDLEGVFQFGDFAGRSIRAWTVASNVGHTWEQAAWKPRLGIKANIASGDTDRADSREGTFYALFPRQSYFSEINLLAPSNFFDLHPSFQVRPSESLLITASWDPFWRYTENDGVYGPGRVAIPASATSGRFVGSTIDLQADWTLTPQLTMSAFYAHFFAGEAVSNAGGKSADFFGTWVTYKF